MPIYESEWDIRVYDLNGGELAVLEGVADRQLHYPLNGIDSFSCTLYLDDPLVDPNALPVPGDPTIMRTTDRVIKVWRTVNDVTDPLSPVTLYQAPADSPDFAGFVTRCAKAGAANTLQIQAQAPLWRLQSRFHLLNHFLVIDYAGQADANHEGGNQDGAVWDISALMFRLIDLVNGAFGGFSFTGIRKPTTGPPFWPKTPALVLGPQRIAKGDNTWTLFSAYLNQVLSPDLVPEYIHVAGQPDLMYFQTAEARGNDVSAGFSFDYLTGNCNLDDFNETEEVLPDKFANYVWSIGQGGPNVSFQVALDNTTAVGYDEVGVYMHQIENESDDVGPGSTLQGQADAELAKVHKRPKTYSLLVSPLSQAVYGVDFTLGDVVMCNANKGALQVSNLKQRVYDVVLGLSDNCVETVDVTVADDFFSTVAAT